MDRETNMEGFNITTGIDPKVISILNPSLSVRCIRKIRGFINHWLYKSGLKKY